MNWTSVFGAMLALGGIGLVFGAILSFAAKKFAVQTDPRVAQVRQNLGGANCGACGFAGCDQFAEAIVQGEASPNGCPAGGAKTAKAIGEIMGISVDAVDDLVARVLCQGEHGVANDRYEYDGYKSCQMASKLSGGNKLCHYACLGLGDCQSVCKFDAIHIEEGLAQINPAKCTACGMCEKTCPRGVIRLLPRDASVIVRCRNSDTGRVARESCMKACIGCKRCEKACQYGAIHVENGYARIDPDKCVRCGACMDICPCGCITA